MTLELINEARENNCRVKIACIDLEISFQTFKRWTIDLEDKRNGPINKPINSLTEEERDKVLNIALSNEYMDYSPWVIVAKLADKGIYLASESTFYKILKENKMLKHRGKSKPAEKKRPAPLVADAPNQVWTWDITYLKTLVKGQFYYVYLFLDIFSRRIVGFDVHEEQTMEHSSSLVSRLCEIEKIDKKQLVLHSDNGGPMKGATMLATLEKLGVCASFSRPLVSNDNPYSESMFKTLKYCPKYPEYFKDLSEADEWMVNFVEWYNNHQHSSIKFVTPNERHLGLDIEILNKRKMVYLKAKQKHPERWGSQSTRNWDREEKVYLNHLQKDKNIDTRIAA